MVRKIMSMVLALALCLSACSFAMAADLHKYDEPVTLTTHTVVNTSRVFQDGDTADSNGFTRWAEEVLGIKIQLKWSAGDGESDGQRLDLAFASDDLPDTISPSASQLNRYVAAGKIVAMDDLINEYGSELVKRGVNDALTVTGGSFFAPVTVSGKAYALPEMSDTLAWWTCNFIRTDILDELECEMPTTLAELEAVMEKYVQAYPGSYPLALANSLQGGSNSINVLLSAYSTAMDMWVEDEEGNLQYTSVQPEMRNALERMAQWYEKGYINPEFVVYDGTKNSEVLAAGDWLATYGYWHAIGAFCDTWANVEGSDISAMPFLLGDDGNNKVIKNSWFDSYRAITTSCENPEAAIYLLNAYWDSYYRNDAQLRDELAGAGYEFYFPVTEVQQPLNPEEQPLLYKYDYPKELQGPRFLNDYHWDGNLVLGLYGKMPIQANEDFSSLAVAVRTNDTSVLTPGGWDLWNGWGASNPKMLTTFASIYEIWDDLEVTPNKFCTAETPTMIEKKAYLDKMELEVFTNIIMGSESIEAFDTFVTEWMDNGGEQITQEVNEWYATTK